MLSKNLNSYLSFSCEIMDEFKFTWKIENFDLCVAKKKGFIKSPIFIAESLEKTAWYLQIYPYGEDDPNYVACYLGRSETDSYQGNVIINFTFSFVLADGSEQLLKTFENQSFSLNQRAGCKDLKRLDDISRERKNLLPRDTFTLRCYLAISMDMPSTSNSKEAVKSLVKHIFEDKTDTSSTNMPTEIYISADRALKELKGKLSPYADSCTSRTEVCVEKRSFIWNLEDFSQLKNKEKVSVPLISASRVTPSLLLTFYLSDESVADQHIQIEIKIKSNCTPVDIAAKCKIALLNERKKPSDFSNSGIYFFEAQKKDQVWLFPPILKKSKLISEVHLRNDTLSLLCEFTLSNGSILNQIEETSYTTGELCEVDHNMENLLSLGEDLSKLSTEATLCDIILQVGKDKFPVHKAILSARSPVFKAMFERDMTEKESGVVKVSDLDAKTLTKMLDFMYGKEAGDFTCESSAKLYSAADKYQCLSLRNVCASFLKNNIAVANVCDVLTLADMHQDEDLKSSARDFILCHGAETLRSDEWKTFMQNQSRLAMETVYQVGLVCMQA